MSFEQTAWAWQQKITPSEKLVLLRLADRCDEDHECWPSVERIGKDTGLCSRTVRRALSKLEERDLITRVDRPQKSNLYRLPTVEITISTPLTQSHPNLPEENLIQSKNPPIVPLTGKTKREIWPVVPMCIDPGVWDDWCQYRRDLERKNKKGVWSPGAARATIREAEKLKAAGHDPSDCLQTAIANGWQGLQLKYFEGNTVGSNGDGRKLSSIDRQIEAFNQRCVREAALEADGGPAADDSIARGGETFEGDMWLK